MAAYDNRHSRVVARLKVLLPVTALAILSTLFLLSDQRGDPRNLPYSQTEIDRIVQDRQVQAPDYAGLTADGSAITLRATTATPDPTDARRMTATDAVATLETPGGGLLNLTATRAILDSGAGTLRLEDGVRIRSNAGYELETQALEAGLDLTHVASDGAVLGRGPVGTLRAGLLELRDDAGDYRLWFTDGVKMLYLPGERVDLNQGDRND